jgi:serine protease Do
VALEGFGPEGFGEVAERLRRSTVHIVRGRGIGSGVIWDSGGLIVTNAHVVARGRASVELWDGRTFEAQVTSRDTHRDLAALKIPADGLPAATARDSKSLRPGELVLAVGNPLGFIGALTTGVIHTLSAGWVQAAVRLAPGNSGGPLADAEGRVIGLNTMVARGGLAFAIPSNAVGEFLKRGGSRAMLGVVIQPVAAGLLILEVTPGSPADAASLRIGDLVTGVNGEPFRSVADLGGAIERSSGVLTLQFLRGDRRARREVTVRLGLIGAAA